MGLRLYQAPVESDIQHKRVDKKPGPSQQARTSVRRSRLRPDVARSERRRLALIENALYDSWERRRQSPGAEPHVTGDGVATGSAESGRRTIDDRVVALFGERWARFHADQTPNTTSGVTQSDLLRRLVPPTSYTMSNMRSTQSSNLPPPTLSRSPRAFGPSPRTGSPLEREDSHILPPVSAAPTSRGRTAAEVWGSHVSAQYDGLGDRNRSLSPEGDNVWDTLLSTLTPDPQPPSVGSSFVSAPATRSAGASSRTSFAGPEVVGEATIEPPCESGMENSEAEGDGDNEMEQNRLTRFPSSLRADQRSYAEVARGDGDDQSLESVGGMDGLQRIIRSYVRREDIPDEWWADAGLSRALSRETTN